MYKVGIVDYSVAGAFWGGQGSAGKGNGRRGKGGGKERGVDGKKWERKNQDRERKVGQ
jgi:hypothetical protein